MANSASVEKGGKALKAGLWYTVSSVTVKAIQVLATPIFTRLIPKEQIGIVDTYNSWYMLLAIFCSLNLTYSIGRAKLDFPGKLDEYVGSMQVLSFLTTLTLCIVCLPVLNPVSAALELNIPMTLILMVNLLLHPSLSFMTDKLRYSYKYKGNIAISMYSVIGSVGLTFLLLLVFKEERYYAKALGHVIPMALLSIAFWIVSIKRKNAKINLTYWKYGLKISLPLILHSVSLNVLGQSDRIMITKFCGTGFTGIYGIAYSYTYLINIIAGSVNSAWLPWFHDAFFEEEYDQIRKNVKPIIMLGCMLGIGCLALAPEAMMIMGPKDYQSGIWVVAPVTVGVVCQYIYQQYVHIELHLKKTQYISIGTIIAAGLNIVLNLIFIPRYGFIAAAYTTMFCYFVLLVVHFLITRLVLKVHIYDDWFAFLAMAVVAVIAAVFMSLYSTYILRYALLAIICLLYVILNRKTVMGAIKKMREKKAHKKE